VLTRAYSLITFKSVNDEERIIEGTATTPEVDRVGDVVVPTGAEFKLPMPLLWQHHADEPIGHVIAATVTKSGIKIRAQIAKHLDLPEIERAWKLIKGGLVGGLSIGFRPLEMEPLNPKEPWGGQKFLRWLWMETSSVTIPANASGTISLVKSLCTSAQSGTGARASSIHSPVASGGSRSGAVMSSISDQLTAATADLKTKSARLEELLGLEGADGGLEEPQIVERNALTPAVETLTARVKQLAALESAQAAMVRPVYRAVPEIDVRDTVRQPAHVPQVTNPTPNTPPGIGLARAVICRMAGLRTGQSPVEIAKQQYRDDPRIAMFLKEDVPAGSTRDNVWAGSLVYAQSLASEFIDFLRPQTIIGRISGFTMIPFNVRIGGQTSGAAGYWVGEGRAKPLTMFNTNATTLGEYKVATISAITQELARFSNPQAETLVRNELARACQERLDIDFIDPDKAISTGVSPASITNGIVNLNSSGNTLDKVDIDVNLMMSAFAQSYIVPTHWIMPNTIALALSLMRTALGARAFPDITMNGGTFMGLPVITSQYCILGTPANNLILLIAAPEIFLADDGGFSVDVSREASLEMNDAPTMSAGPLGSPVGATGSVVVSMFQTNSMAIRCERFINWARKRSGAVVWMDDVQWTPS
jgi:HK97 family phage major capsid protein/HK97 family phage prohead protease